MKNHTTHRSACALLAMLALLSGRAWAQATATANPGPAQPAKSAKPAATGGGENEAIVLSPFEVTTSKDKGYKATNAISGTRLNTAIKLLPLPVEVITNEFMRDTGALSLREALRYSSGIILDSQNDALTQPNDSGASGSAGANDPRGVTRNQNNTTTKIRGFVVDQVLRDGFRRQSSSDWINIDRVEVVRGPQALLYGVGSFGGVINYLPKRPQQQEHTYFSAAIGDEGVHRFEVDYTAPLGQGLASRPAFRVTAAYQDGGDYTQYYHNKQVFISPVFSFHPFKNTEIVFDNEFGFSDQRGIGFQSIRDRIGTASQAVNRGSTFITAGTQNGRTFRWSGPDTYAKSPTRNHVIDLTQKINDDLFIRAGFGWNYLTRSNRNINNTALIGGTSPAFNLTNSLDYYPDATVSLGGASYNLASAIASPPGSFTAAQVAAARPSGAFRGDRLYGTVPNLSLADQFNLMVNPTSTIPTNVNQTVIQYQWIDGKVTEDRTQFRVDANYKLEWHGRHNFVAGLQQQQLFTKTMTFGPPRTYTNFNVPREQGYSFKNPTDYSPFTFGRQGDGLPDPKMTALDGTWKKNWDLGYFAVYQGQFFHNRLTLIGGYRWDRDDSRNAVTAYDQKTYTRTDRSQLSSRAPTKTSPQVGVSFAVTPELSVFALYSTGLVPNYGDLDGNGVASPTTARNREAGVKFDLLDGRVSGTISAYKIERKNTPRFIWWAPAPYKAATDPYDTGKPQATVWQYMGPESVWYAIKSLPNGLAEAKKVFPSGYWPTLDAMATVPASAGSKYYPDGSTDAWKTATPGASFNNAPTNWWGFGADAGRPDNKNSSVYFPLVNLNDPQVAEFTNAAFVWASKDQSNNTWPGQFYGYRNGQQLRYGDGTYGVQNIPNWNGANVPINDQATGWDAQFIVSPTNRLQFVFNYAHVTRKITSQFYQYVKAPYFPYAFWYYPQYSWGTLNGSSPASAYTDPKDSSTSKVQIAEFGQSEDDTPKEHVTVWARYDLAGFERLKGWAVGLGGQWTGRRQWYSGFNTDGTTITVTDPSGQKMLVQYWTKPELLVNGLVEYRRRLSEKYDFRAALNVNNLLDNQKLYGYTYAPGRSVRFTTSLDF